MRTVRKSGFANRLRKNCLQRLKPLLRSSPIDQNEVFSAQIEERRIFATTLRGMANKREPQVPFSFMHLLKAMTAAMMELTERIEQLLGELFATDERLTDCFTVEISLQPRNKLCVFVDSDSGINFDKCKTISRYLEGHLDANGWLGERYILEVSSPGVGRPLRLWRQYRNNIGRHLLVTLQDGTVQRGVLKTVEADHLILAQQTEEKQGKKAASVFVERLIPFEQIATAVVKIVF